MTSTPARSGEHADAGADRHHRRAARSREPPTVELREQERGIGPLTVVAEDVGDSNYHAITDIPFAGTWEVSVRARTSTFDSGVASTSSSSD